MIKSWRMRWAEACSTHERNVKFVQNLVGKPEGKRPLERLRCRWEDNININLTEIV
jgi:hypothetical protein